MLEVVALDLELSLQPGALCPRPPGRSELLLLLLPLLLLLLRGRGNMLWHNARGRPAGPNGLGAAAPGSELR
jgi:hypothetical protein